MYSYLLFPNRYKLFVNLHLQSHTTLPLMFSTRSRPPRQKMKTPKYKCHIRLHIKVFDQRLHTIIYPQYCCHKRFSKFHTKNSIHPGLTSIEWNSGVTLSGPILYTLLNYSRHIKVLSLIIQ